MVDTTADTPDATPGDGVCADASGLCSFRAAVMEANALPGRNTVRIASTTPVTIGFGTPIEVSDDLTLEGPGPGLASLEGALVVRQGEVSIRGLKLRSLVNEEAGTVFVEDGEVTTGGAGRAVRNRGRMRLRRVVIHGNGFTRACS